MKQKGFFLILLLGAIFLAIFVLFSSNRSFLAEKGGCPCVNLETATGEFVPGEKEAYFEEKRVLSPLATFPGPSLEEQKVLGETTGEEKWIEVDLSEQKLRAWEGNNLFLETLISSGKPWTPTITGEFRIWSKFHFAKMSGGSKERGDYYYLPNVPYIMYFQKDFGLHGTYWHSNFGQTMSRGCVNLPTPMAEKLYYWTTPKVPQDKHTVLATADNPGTRVVVHE